MSSRTALFIFLALSRCFVASLAQVNVTIDDGDPAIAYSGTWIPFSSPLDAGGSHRLGEDDGVLAKFTFTGTAIYFMSPLWPYEVFTQLQLDSQPPVQLNLSDPNLAIPSHTGEETVKSEVVWGTANLPNVSHTLQISKVPGKPYAIVDTLIYTIPDSSLPSSSSSSSLSSSSTMTADSSATSPPVKMSSQSSTPVLTIALTTIFGFLGLCLAAVASWVCCKGRHGHKAEAWSVNDPAPLPTIPPAGSLSPQAAHDFKNTSRSGSNSHMATSLASNPQPLIYPPPEIEQNFNPYINPPQMRMIYQQLTELCLQQRGTLSYAPRSLSTITEKSTPGTGAAGSSPISLPSTDLSYYTPGSQSAGTGPARLSYASDTSPGVVGSGTWHQQQPQPHLYTSGSAAQLRSPGSFGSLSHEMAKPSKLRNGKNVMVAVNGVEDAGESSRLPAYTLR